MIEGRKTHPAADIFPLLHGDAFEALCEDIAKHGLRRPIVVERSTELVLDGRNRLRACEVTGEPVIVRLVEASEIGDPVEYILSLNLHRRHLSESQRALAAARAVAGGMFANLQTSAEAFAVSARSITSALDVLGYERDPSRGGRPRKDAPLHPPVDELEAAVDAGWLAVSAAAEVRQLPPAEQLEVLEEVAGDGRAVRGAIAARRRAACPQCEGAGFLDELGEVECPACRAPSSAGEVAPVVVELPPDEEFVDAGDETVEDPARAHAVALSQWYTPPALARRMVELAALAPGVRVLEPSAGTGNIVRALRELTPSCHVTAHELDPGLVPGLRDLAHTVHEGDFLACPAPSCDASIQNTPYENGLDGLFLERAMDCTRLIVALLRTNALHGRDRHERVWSRVSRGEWGLTHLRYLDRRPPFEGPAAASGAKSDFVVVRLELGRPCKTDVDWWEFESW